MSEESERALLDELLDLSSAPRSNVGGQPYFSDKASRSVPVSSSACGRRAGDRLALRSEGNLDMTRATRRRRPWPVQASVSYVDAFNLNEGGP